MFTNGEITRWRLENSYDETRYANISVFKAYDTDQSGRDIGYRRGKVLLKDEVSMGRYAEKKGLKSTCTTPSHRRL
jgi:hypothetical protein